MSDTNIEVKQDNSASQEKGIKARMPLWAKIFYISALVCIPLYILFLIFPSFSDFFNRYVSSVFRAILAYLTSWIPFSLAEFLIILAPLWIVLLVIYGMSKRSETWRDVLIYCASMFSIVGFIFSSFTLGFASAYRGSKLETKLGLENDGVDTEELYYTTLYYANLTAKEAKNVSFIRGGFSIMPYNYNEMNKHLLDAYDKACDKYDFLQKLDSTLKPVMLSEPMSYTHITGVYTFFTGEANINVAFPDYTIPFTAAHELAHQRGIAREDEANFVAFLVCMDADDPYLRYSAYLNIYEYLSNALYRADRELYYETVKLLPREVRDEMAAYSEFFNKYRDSAAADISGAVNNTFLTIQGTEGTKSYGMVVDLAVAYFNKRSAN